MIDNYLNAKKVFLTLTLLFFAKMDYGQTADSGEIMFKNNCAVCHSIRQHEIVGPPLINVINEKKEDWFISFTLHSQDMIRHKDKGAVDIYEKYKRIEHPNFEKLSKNDVKKIYNFIKSKNNIKE